jgi:hypothetical protein
MKKITGILLMNFLPVLVIAQSENPSGGEGFVHHFVSDERWLTYLALLFGVVAIALHLRSRKLSKSKDHSGNRTSIGELQQELGWLRSSLNSKPGQSDLNGLAEKIKLIEDKIEQMERPVREKEWTDFKKTTMAQNAVTASQPHVPDLAQTDGELFYAKLADLDDGFSFGIISPIQNGEQIYEIQTAGDTAVYRISSDANAQKYALAESTFTLGKACELLNQPFKGCQIVLQQEGSLIKISGNWIIQQKAKIEFK